MLLHIHLDHRCTKRSILLISVGSYRPQAGSVMPPDVFLRPLGGSVAFAFFLYYYVVWLTAAVGSHYCLLQCHVDMCILQGAFMYWYVTFMHNSIAHLLFLAWLL